MSDHAAEISQGVADSRWGAETTPVWACTCTDCPPVQLHAADAAEAKRRYLDLCGVNVALTSPTVLGAVGVTEVTPAARRKEHRR
jgi:hypothetical protein